MSTKIIAFINLKGGVAKTTTTVGLAHVLASVFAKKVLVIDLDPQTNATAMLIGDKKWLELDKKGYTLATLFDDAVYNRKEFELAKTLQTNVGDVKEVKTLDLLPSSLRIIDLQDRLTSIPAGRFQLSNVLSVLLNGIHYILENYDYILIDCPPNLGYITLNGLFISDGYIIPTIPDVLSTYGIPQIVTRVNTFSHEIKTFERGSGIIPLGIVATKVRSIAYHQRELERIRSRSGKSMADSNLQYPAVFNTYFPEKSKTAEAAEYVNYHTLRQKWGYSGEYEVLKAFTEEFIEVCKEI